MSKLKSIVASAMNTKITKKAEETNSVKTPIRSLSIFDKDLLLSNLQKKIGAMYIDGQITDIIFVVDPNRSFLEWTLDVNKIAEDGFEIGVTIKDIKVVGSIEAYYGEDENVIEDGIEITPLDINETKITVDTTMINSSESKNLVVVLQQIDIDEDGIKIMFK